MLRRARIGLLLAAGCNGLFGLDETVADTNDSDRDGVLDDVDNCPGLANPDQTDEDQDGIGDPCDPSPDGLTCPLGTRTGIDANGNMVDDGCEGCSGIDDEDSDSILNSCDVCPGLTDLVQDDTDDDGVGDACDTSREMQARQLFDGFVIDGEPATAWIKASGWTVSGGTIQTAAFVEELQLSFAVIGVVSGDWSITAGIVLPPTTNPSFDGTFVGFSVIEEVPAGKPSLCGFEYNALAQAWFLMTTTRAGGGTKDTFTMDPVKPIQLRMSLDEKEGLYGFTCEVIADRTFTVDEPFTAGAVRLSFNATAPMARFTYADVVQ